MQGNVLGQSGAGSKIKGLIEEYQVADGEEIKAGDFVEYINNVGTKNTLNNKEHSGLYLSAVKLTEDKIFVAHSNTSKDSLFATIYSITNNNKIEETSSLQLTTSGVKIISIIKLTENKIFILYKLGTFLYGTICSINKNIIAKEKTTQLTNKTTAGENYASAVKLSENKIFAIYNVYNSNDIQNLKLCGILCTINENVITVKADTEKNLTNNGSSYINMLCLNENKILVTYISYAVIYGTIYNIINNSEIEKGKEIQLGSTRYILINGIKIEDNKVLVAFYSDKDNLNYLYGIMCSIEDDDVITVTSENELTSFDFYSPNKFLMMKFKKNKIIIILNLSNKNDSIRLTRLHSMLYEIKGNKIELENFKALEENGSDDLSTLIKLTENKYVILFNSGSDHILKGMVNNIKIAHSLVGGVSKTSGKSGDTIKVIVPNYEEEEGE